MIYNPMSDIRVSGVSELIGSVLDRVYAKFQVIRRLTGHCTSVIVPEKCVQQNCCNDLSDLLIEYIPHISMEFHDTWHTCRQEAWVAS